MFTGVSGFRGQGSNGFRLYGAVRSLGLVYMGLRSLWSKYWMQGLGLYGLLKLCLVLRLLHKNCPTTTSPFSRTGVYVGPPSGFVLLWGVEAIGKQSDNTGPTEPNLEV